MFSSPKGATFVIIGKTAKNISRPFFLCFRHLLEVSENTSVTYRKLFVPLHRLLEVGQSVLTLPTPSAKGSLASQERLHESLWVAPLL